MDAGWDVSVLLSPTGTWSASSRRLPTICRPGSSWVRRPTPRRRKGLPLSPLVSHRSAERPPRADQRKRRGRSLGKPPRWWRSGRASAEPCRGLWRGAHPGRPQRSSTGKSGALCSPACGGRHPLPVAGEQQRLAPPASAARSSSAARDLSRVAPSAPAAPTRCASGRRVSRPAAAPADSLFGRPPRCRAAPQTSPPPRRRIISPSRRRRPGGHFFRWHRRVCPPAGGPSAGGLAQGAGRGEELRKRHSRSAAPAGGVRRVLGTRM